MDLLQHDFYDWSSCLIQEGLSPAQTEAIRASVAEQSTAEI